MNVAVVGATGVLGRALIPQLLKNDHEVRALARNPALIRQRYGETVEVVECDLLASRIAEKLPALLAGCDAIIHAATAIPKDPGTPGAMATNNRLRTEATPHLLAAALQVGAQVYVQQSIAFAYPDSGDQWITETTPLDPQRQVLINMEGLVRAVPTSQLRWSIARGGIFVGRDTFQDDTIERLRAGTEIVAGGGLAFMPLIHVEDMAAGVVVMVKRAPAGSTFNLVDEPIRQNEYLDRLAAAVGAPMPPRDPNSPDPPSHRVSNQAAKDVLGWTPTHDVIPTNS